jgi:ribosomal protein S18 acetylase RimI-like enzyme
MSKKKQPKFRILSGKSGDIADFWPLMGPVIAGRTVQKELNDRMFDDERTLWFVAVDPDYSHAVGCCAARVTSKRCVLTYGWVIPELRGTHCYSELVKARKSHIEEIYPGFVYEAAVDSANQQRHYEKDGFKKTHIRGSYTVMTKNKG